MSTSTVAKRRKALLTRIAERGDADARLDTPFLDAYFQHVLTEDLLRAHAEDLHGAVANHLSLAGCREPGQIQVQAFTPNVDTHGWGTGATILQVVADDTPFIVDSIIAELGRQGRQIRLLAHPQLRVGRDDQGNLTSLDAQDGARESWAHVELAATADPAAADEIAAGVRAALQDVALAVADWQPMVARASQITAETEEGTQQLLQWLPQDNFLFLGYRQYRFTVPNGDLGVLESIPGTGLGILRGPESRRELTGSALARAVRKPQLTITKANALSTVRRSERLDYIGIKTFDSDGNVNGEHRFVGLFTARAYNESIEAIPFLAGKTREVLDQSGFEPRSHAAKHLLSVLQTYPRDEVLQADANHLSRMVNRVVASRHHRKTMLFVRNDEFERFVSCVVMVPRDRYSTDALERIGTILLDAFQGAELEHAVSMPSSQANTAIVHFVVRMGPGQQIPDADVADLEGWIRGAIRTWPEDWEGSMGTEFGEIDGHRLIAKWGPGLDEAYRATHSPRQATLDVRYLENLGTEELQANLYTPQGAQPNERRLRLYSSRPIGLTEVLPKLLSFGVDVFDERSFDVVLPDGASRYLLDYGLAADSAGHWGTASRPSGFLAGFLAVWRGQCETDGFNRLVGSGDLTWPQVVILRMIAAYLAQTTQYSRDYIQAALTTNSAIAVGLVEVFEARFTPDGQADRVSAEQQAADAVVATLADVPNLDHDRIIRAALSVIRAGLRTNFYQPVGQDTPPSVIAFKVEPERIPHLLPPRPQLEIWVYGASVEGAHFRFGRIARGGIRWSSRREDFRTEVLGLVKAQMVKNSVIVPTGAKGAFYPKNLPDPQRDPAAWREEGRQAYRAFITALLSITDNLVDGETVHPERVVRHDEDDTYLVVAADKGTATFSDLANEIAEEHRFWLGDAFASGGSTGYDHKAMAITARGAWTSVTRHFRELGIDPAAQDFTAVGVGDMSGDVFGNGMLQSRHTRLVAAFDHRDIFIDPDPDPASSYAERQRLFTLPRSSWQDYSTELISDGGGVFSRSAKVVPISPRMQELLPALDGAAEATPAQVIRAILQARVDLVWNGGIGTYIKASTERNEEIGDPGNDSVRVDGNQLNCAVVGEGGNLGVSQLGRIEAAQNGVRINTDAIDNSAGVDSSDYEVNIKILLNGLVSEGKMTIPQRNQLLRDMTDDVAAHVLRTNYVQNVLLGNARNLGTSMLGAHDRLMKWLEARGSLNRDLEALPDSDEMRRRAADGEGLTSPEFSVLVAHAKISLRDDLLDSDLPDDPWFDDVLVDYFPPALAEFPEAIKQHPLRREIVATALANSIVNRGGITFVQRAMEEMGATPVQVAHAFMVLREVLGMDEFVRQVEALDSVLSPQTQTVLYLEYRRLMDSCVRHLLGRRHKLDQVQAEVARYRDVVAGIAGSLDELLPAEAVERVRNRSTELESMGIPAELARRTAQMSYLVAALEIVDLAELDDLDPVDSAEAYFRIAEGLQFDQLLGMLRGLPQEELWDSAAGSSLRQDLYRLVGSLTSSAMSGNGVNVGERVAQWTSQRAADLDSFNSLVAQLRREKELGLGHAWVLLRDARRLADR